MSLVKRVFSRRGSIIKAFTIMNPPKICEVKFKDIDEETNSLQVKFSETYGTKIHITYQTSQNDRSKISYQSVDL